MDYIAVNTFIRVASNSECEVTRLDNYFTTTQSFVCIHYQGHVYCCEVHFTYKETVAQTHRANLNRLRVLH
jgi:hypothetical protein